VQEVEVSSEVILQNDKGTIATVTLNGDDITAVEVVGDSETQGIGTNAIDQLPALIEEADSTEVDVVAGATVTSNAIIEAVNNALASK